MRNKKRRMVFSILSLLVMIIGAGAGLYILQKENLELRREAEVTREAALLLVPLDQAPIEIEPDTTFDVTVYLDTSSFDVVGADVVLDYSENLSLENIALPSEQSFPTYAPVTSTGAFDVEKAIAQNSFGIVTFDWDNETAPIQDPVNGTVVLATLTFRAISEGEGSVGIFYAGESGKESTTDSNVVHIDVNGNVNDILRDPANDGYVPVLVATTPVESCVDNDGDGFNLMDETSCPLGTDCNDNDNDVHPEATEICNNIDDDCDDQIDENLSRDCVDSSTGCQGTQQCSEGDWNPCECPTPPCVDNDGDGYDAYDATSCPLGNDCNDSDANIHPQAIEICNGLDENCDNLVDENLTQDCQTSNGCDGTQQCIEGSWGSCSCPIVCEDNDGDGYNGYNATQCELGTDCDDTNANIHPGSLEQCNNIDDNCNDLIDESITRECIGDADCQGVQGCANGTWGSCECTEVPCTPQCAGLQCGGDDGCGGICGTCREGKICTINFNCVSISRGKNLERKINKKTQQLSIVMGDWNQTDPTDKAADVNQDGLVDIYDAADILATKKQVKPPEKKVSSLSLSLSESVADIVEGDEFDLDVVLDAQGEEITGVTADFTYDSNAFDVVSVTAQDSVFDTSIEETAENGLVQLSQIKQGNPYTRKGKIATLTLKPKTVGTATFSFKTEDAVMNTGAQNVLGAQDDLTVTIKEKSFWGKLEDRIAENPLLAAGIMLTFSAIIGAGGYAILKLVKKDSGNPPIPPTQGTGGSQKPKEPSQSTESEAAPVATPPTPLEQGVV